MSDANLPAMLTLAALTYRGFQDVLPGEPHEVIVRRALLDGLDSLPSVKGEWELVWGPVTSRLPLGVFDSSAMYVVRHRGDRRRYVVAIRGTSPVSSSDWLFGDFWVGATVRWPYASDSAAVSMSTALGLASLQAMRGQAPSAVGRFANAALSAAPVASAFGKVAGASRAMLSGTSEAQVAHPSSLEAQVERIFTSWLAHGNDRDRLLDAIQQTGAALHLEPSDLRPKCLPGGRDLLSFLKEAADASDSALDVTVTGHSKGGALAPTVALWLADALASGVPDECWDTRRRAQVLSYAFAGPTPGNEAFAARIDRVLADSHHHLRNTNDLVTNAWQVSELTRLPTLYGTRSEPFAPLLPGILRVVQPMNYRHATRGVVSFAGTLDPKRPVAAEFIHQHLDAYLDHLGLRQQGVNAVTFFI